MQCSWLGQREKYGLTERYINSLGKEVEIRLDI